MRILVTGGAGFIGQQVVAKLATSAERVVVLDSLRPDVHRDAAESARGRLSASGADLVVGDVRDRPAVAAALRGIDVVVHLAAKVGLGVGVDDMADYVSAGRSISMLVVGILLLRLGTGRLVVGIFSAGE